MPLLPIVIMFCVIIRGVSMMREVLLNAVTPSVTFFILMQSIKLSAIMLSDIILSVVMLSVEAPSNRFKKGLEFETKFCLSHPKTFFSNFCPTNL